MGLPHTPNEARVVELLKSLSHSSAHNAAGLAIVDYRTRALALAVVPDSYERKILAIDSLRGVLIEQLEAIAFRFGVQIPAQKAGAGAPLLMQSNDGTRQTTERVA